MMVTMQCDDFSQILHFFSLAQWFICRSSQPTAALQPKSPDTEERIYDTVAEVCYPGDVEVMLVPEVMCGGGGMVCVCVCTCICVYVSTVLVGGCFVGNVCVALVACSHYNVCCMCILVDPVKCKDCLCLSVCLFSYCVYM